MTPDIALVLLLRLATMLAFGFELLPVDVVTLILIVVLVVTGLLTQV